MSADGSNGAELGENGVATSGHQNGEERVKLRKQYSIKKQEGENSSEDPDDVKLKELARLSGVHEADGGFFESFSALSWKQENRKLQAIRQDEAEKAKPPPSEGSVGIEPPTHKIGKREWQQLYVAVLYTINNQIGASPKEKAPPLDDLYEYAKRAFAVIDQDHAHLMEIASKEKPPILVLNVTVVEAQGLEAKDPDGYSDPFCMLGIQPEAPRQGSHESPEREEAPSEGCPEEVRKKQHSFKLSFKRKKEKEASRGTSSGGPGNGVGASDNLSNDIPAKYISATTVKRHNLNPHWDEKFQFTIEDIGGDKLHLDIWDNDDESSVIDAVRKLNQVQSWKGLGRYFKQVAQSARSHGAYSVDDFLGCVNVTLHDLPSTGVDRWYELQGRSHRSNVQGRIRLRLSLSTRDRDVSGQDHWWDVREHEHLLRVFIDFELARLKEDNAHKWQGQLPQAGNTILHQHAIQSDLTSLQYTVCEWRAYSWKHMQKAFDYGHLYKLLQKLNAAWDTEALSKDEESSLSESFSQFVEYSLALLRKQMDLFPPGNVAAAYKLEYLLRCLALLSEMQAFWRCCPFHKDLHVEVAGAIKKGTTQRFDWLLKQTTPSIKTDDTLLKSYIDFINALNVDLYKNLQYNTKLFESIMNVNNFAITYKELDKLVIDLLRKNWMWKVVDDIKETVMQLCDRLKEDAGKDLSRPDSEMPEDNLTIGTAMFEMYMALQEFVTFKQHLPANDRRSLGLTGFHEWFAGAALRWLSIARYKLMLRIRKAVQLDKANQIDTNLKLSTSAVDTTSCFYQIKEFWKQLALPDLIASYAFVFKILDDICNGAMYYADLMQQRLMDEGYYDLDGQFDVTDKLCLAINNVEHVRRALKPLPEELGLEAIFTALAKADGEARGIQCRRTLHTMLQSAEEDMAVKIITVVKRVAERMRPDVKKYVFHLAWAPDALPTDDAIVPLMEYLDNNLATLNDTLLHVNFQRILEAIWLVIIEEMDAQGQSAVGEKQTVFFARLHDALGILVEFFHANQKGLALQKLQTNAYRDFEDFLDMHRSDAETLISKYCLEQQKEQERNSGTREFGTLTVKAYFRYDCLCVEVLQASDIMALDPNGYSDPFVIIELLPNHIFPNCPVQKTKVKKKTLHPLFDECFEYCVRLDQCSTESATVLFTVMDHDIMLSNDFAGEANLALPTIPGVVEKLPSADLSTVKPVELSLLRPKYKDNVILTTLEKRIWDKTAQDFVKRRKAHMV